MPLHNMECNFLSKLFRIINLSICYITYSLINRNYLPSHFRFTKRKAIYIFDTITSTVSGYTVLCPFQLIDWLAGWQKSVSFRQPVQHSGKAVDKKPEYQISAFQCPWENLSAFQAVRFFISKIGGGEGGISSALPCWIIRKIR